jgi:hypothetical protein
MLKKFALFLVSALISAFVLEIVLRTFFPVYTTSPLRAYQYDPELGVRLRPGIHLLETTDFQQEVQVNQLGTVNFQENFNEYKSLVFAVGDSFTQGTGLPSDMSYPAQLDLYLNEDQAGFYRKEYGVVNLGLAAYGGQQNLIALRRWAATIGKPSYILYLGCDNDYEDDLAFNGGYRHNHIVEGNPKWGALVRPLQWMTNDLQIGLRVKLAIQQVRRAEISSTANSSEAKSAAEMEEPVLEELNAFAKDSGSNLIVSWSDQGKSYDWLKEWANRSQVAFADWRPKVDSVDAAIPNLPIDNPHSGGHHRGWVNKMIAEEYGRLIRQLRHD